MVKLHEGGVFLLNNNEIIPEAGKAEAEKKYKDDLNREEARKGTIAWSILNSHNTSDDMNDLRIRFDAMTSHDITFVGIIQTARASGMEKFPIPYVLTNCHNSLCAVGGTINEDDHVFGLSAAKKYGGIFVPPHIAVIHQYMREAQAGCGKMILGSDSHTRYGALGTMAVGEGGGELVKQLLEDTWDIPYPKVINIHLTGKPRPGIGPQDIALAIIGAVYENGYVKNSVMEFTGPGIETMSTDYRNSVDVMTTETTCLSSIWVTDDDTKAFLEQHGRGEEYKKLQPEKIAYYDGCVEVDLSRIESMIALPFHPSNTYTIDELNRNAEEIFNLVEENAREITSNPDVAFTMRDKIVNGKIQVQQGVIAGCAGGNWCNIMAATQPLQHGNCGNGAFNLSVYPSSQPVLMDLVRGGAVEDLIKAGAVVKTAFCGPCFGAGDTPSNNGLSIRHTTRNFPSREGSKPGDGQLAAVALMDARSIAATAVGGGILTPATQIAEMYDIVEKETSDYHYDEAVYESRVYRGFGKAKVEEDLIYGPNIKDWPEQEALRNNVLLKVCSKIMDPVTTTDELIPSGETSSYRSNPLGLAEFTLSRRDPEYVERAKAAKATDEAEIRTVIERAVSATGSMEGSDISISDPSDVQIGSVIYCVRPGDGSAREQAASCQRVLGGLANICEAYATKRYRSNVINWGMLPFQMKDDPEFEVGDWIFIPDVLKALEGDMNDIPAYVIRNGETGEGGGTGVERISLYISDMTDTEKDIVRAGCLINFNRNRR